MALVRLTPNREIDSLQREMNRLFDDIFAPSPTRNRISAFTPAAELTEKGETYHLKLELPGIRKEDLDIEVTSETVSVRGDRKSATETEETGVTRSEFHYGSFHRVISLPGRIDHQSVVADYQDGILDLTLPKAEEEKHKIVKVNLG